MDLIRIGQFLSQRSMLQSQSMGTLVACCLRLPIRRSSQEGHHKWSGVGGWGVTCCSTTDGHDSVKESLLVS